MKKNTFMNRLRKEARAWPRGVEKFMMNAEIETFWLARINLIICGLLFLSSTIIFIYATINYNKISGEEYYPIITSNIKLGLSLVLIWLLVFKKVDKVIKKIKGV